jgi:hypothetical protein
VSKLFLSCGLAAGVTLAVLIGQRMSTDAMAVVIGVGAGVVASVPTSILLVALLRRSTPRLDPPPANYSHLPAAPAAPPVIVIDAAALRQLTQVQPAGLTGGGRFALLDAPPTDGRHLLRLIEPSTPPGRLRPLSLTWPGSE